MDTKYELTVMFPSYSKSKRFVCDEIQELDGLPGVVMLLNKNSNEIWNVNLNNALFWNTKIYTEANKHEV